MAEYTVLARRFRPQSFDDVIGQEMVARALRNAITGSRVAHAYLFTGARGVGKTSMARILAKALNCPDSDGPNPCNTCEICHGIAEGADVDVLEIDGASNRGIEDIRALRANVNVKSMRSRYKVYIIDEVHMLTREAFNALLKTLEEPPPTVKFIFCTTEPNRLPDTILSRCQRFDFGTIATTSISERLRQIADCEGIGVDPAAIELVARRAAGSMRDSQSLFDQLLAFGGDPITAADVHRLFGTADDERLVELFDAIVNRRADQALTLFDTYLTEGIQLGELTSQFITYLRDLMVLAGGASEVSLLSVSEEHRAGLTEQAKHWGMETILAAMQIVSETKVRMARVSYGRALAELAVVRLGMLEDLQDLAELVRQANSAAPATPQKKNDVIPAASTPKPPVEQPKQVAFQSGSETEIWAQVLSQLTDMLKANASQASGIAISGPNGMEILFPKSYYLSKQYCDRADQTARLQEVVEAVTGQKVRISTRLAEEESQPKEANQANSGSSTAEQAVRPEEDPLVRQVIEVFGAKVVKVEGRKTPR